MFPSSPIPLLTSYDVVHAGHSRNALPKRTRGARADLVKIRPGVYADQDSWKSLRPEKRHLARVCAARAGKVAPGDRAALARESAAVVYGFPMIGPIPKKLSYVVSREQAGTRSSSVARIMPVPAQIKRVRIDGVLLTSPAQTLVDLGRTRSLASSLASMDFALAQRMVEKSEMFAVLDAQPGLRGNVRARRAVELADGRSESVGESLSRAMMVTHYLPLPQLQEEILTKEGIMVGRVDFLWREFGVVGEFDGAGKYLGDGAGGARTAMDERHRENLIERTSGMRVVRWTWDDAYRDDADGMLMILRSVGITPHA